MTPNKIVSIFDEIGLKVAKEMAEEGCCHFSAPSALCSIDEFRSYMAVAGIPIVDGDGDLVLAVVGLSKHNLKVFRQRVKIYENIKRLNLETAK